MSQPGNERRNAIRYACVLRASWEGGDCPQLGDGWVGRVVDLSTSGMRLHLGEGFPAGATLLLGLHGEHDSLSPVEVRVVHGTKNPDSTWYLGVAFVKPLTEKQLKNLLS